MLFHDGPELVFGLNAGTDRQTVVNRTRSISFSGLNRGTSLATTLQFVNSTVLQTNQGRRSNVPVRIVIITDGRASETQASLTSAVSVLNANHDVLIAAVGIGNADRTQLVTVASSDDIVFSISDFATLESTAFFNTFESRVFGCAPGTFETTPCTSTGPRVCSQCTTNCTAGSFLSGTCIGTQDSVCLNCTSCRAGTFRERECNGNQDTVCTPCTQPICSSGFYSTPCTTTTDASCLTCSTCGINEFISRSCSSVSDTQCDTCRPPCASNEYEAVPCGFNGQDRICLPCSTSCAAGQYEIQACSSIRDTVCAPCSQCSPNEYVSSLCTTTTDTVCTTRSICSGSNQFEIFPATNVSDAVCAPCTNNCGSGFFISTPCSSHNNTVCEPCSQCTAGNFVSSPCDGVTNTVCQPCSTNCPLRHFRVAECSESGSDLQCLPCTDCGIEEYETVQCSETSNSVCTRCSESCIPGFYEATSCGTTTDRSCLPCSSCDSSQFEVQPCNTANDTVCRACTECSPGFREVSPCTASSDRVCEPCDACPTGQFEVASCNTTHSTQCAPCVPQQCAVGEFEVVSCSGTSNRECQTCSVCADHETTVSNCNSTTDTVCAQCTCCGTNEFEVSACSATAQTTCGACATCVPGVSYSQTPCGSACVACSSPCNSSTFEILACENNHDRVCVNPVEQFDSCTRSTLQAHEIPNDPAAIAIVSSNAECARRCLDRPTCTGYSFSASRSTCLLLASYEIGAPSNTVPTSSDFMYCERRPTSVDLLTANSLPIGFLGTGHSGAILSRTPSVGQTLSIGTVFTLPPSGNGYILSVSNQAGSLRYYALYSTLDGQSIDFYYTDSDLVMRRERFSAAVADGIEHTLVLLVRYGTPPILQFVLDGQQVIRHLPVSELAICENDCVATVGMRSSATGGRFFFDGFITQVHLFPSSAILSAVQSALSTGAQTVPWQAVIGRPVTFSGGTGLRFTDSATSFRVSGNVTVYFTVRQQSGSSGYVFSKSNPAGDIRYLSLYSRPGAIWLYYMTRGTRHRVVFPQALADGNLHRAELTLTTSVVRLLIDGVPNVQPLAGPLEDCGVLSSSCILAVGDRSPANFAFEGEISILTIARSGDLGRLC